MTMMKARSASNQVYRIGPYWFDPGRKSCARDGGAKIGLTAKEVLLLQYLLRATGRSVSRAELLEEVWGYRPDTDTHTIETHVYRLRRKIEPDPPEYRLLIWRDGGYRLDLNG